MDVVLLDGRKGKKKGGIMEMDSAQEFAIKVRAKT
jgi:hypothetical protein